MQRFSVIASIFLMAGLATMFLVGCDIEETPPPRTGSVRVTLSDNPDTLDIIQGAAIWIDGRETFRRTPATLAGIPVGMHTISTFKPGLVDTSATIEIVVDQTVQVDFVTAAATSGAIDLVNAPTGTVLLLNSIPVGAVPTIFDPPTLFEGLGIGSFRVSAYLPGHATEFPAPWTVALSDFPPFTLTPIFSSVPEGIAPGNLAPIVPDTLLSDWDRAPVWLQDYRGQVVLLTFFYNNCSGCIEEFPRLQAVYDDPAFQGKFVVIGADFVDPYNTFANFRDTHRSLGLTFPLVHNRTQSLRDAYNVTTHPANFLIDQTGRIRMARGGVSEPELRQQLNALIGSGQTETFRFEMRESLIEYTDGDRTFEFHATVTNLLAAPRSFVFQLHPISYPDTTRQSSICVADVCTAPRAGAVSYTTNFNALAADSGVYFTIYNFVTDPESGFPVPSPVSGDHTLDVSVYPADNVSDVITHRLLLDDVSGGSFVVAPRHIRSR